MAADFLTTSRESYSRAREELDRHSRGANLFLWTVLIVVLIAMNAGIWTFSMMVFGYPEKAFNYRLLTKLHRLEPIARFPALSAPKGKFRTPKQLYESFYAYSPKHLKALNSVLKRQYIRNYEEGSDVVYARGTFRIYQVRELTADDYFTRGLVLRAVFQEYPQVVIEYIMPMDEVPEEHFAVGDDLDIDVHGSSAFAALINVEKLREYKICFSLVPLVYGSYQLPNGKTIQLSPPKELNTGAKFPITDEAIGEPALPDG